MCSIKIVEMRDQCADPRSDVERLQHVAAYEIREIAHRLHRNGLMEQLQRLFVVDAEAAPEPSAVFRKTILDVGARRSQLLAQQPDVGTEMSKVAGDRQLSLHADEKSVPAGLVLPSSKILAPT